MSTYTRTAAQSFFANALSDAFDALVEGGITSENSAKFFEVLPAFLEEFIVGDISTITSPDRPGAVTIEFVPI